MAAEETEFPLVVRGYERAAVDDAMRDLRREILQLSGQNAQLATELRDTNNRLIEAQQTISEVGEPTYAGVGAKAALILATAEEQAKRLIQDAETERDRIRKNLAVELDEQRGQAKGYYDALVAEAQRRADRIIGSSKTDYEATIAEATERAAELIATAEREASATRGAVATEAARLRATTKRETELLRAATERDLAEKKLIAQRQSGLDIDTERARQLVTEQARIDLELELTARRAEAETEYLRKHQEAVAATQKYLDEANANLANALTRANAARLEAETLEAAAKAITRKTTDDARSKADSTIAAADAEARGIIKSAQEKANTEVRAAEERLQKLYVERDAIKVYIKNLRTVMDRIQFVIDSN
ncbi:MAG: hypothetical protein RL672_468 [Actinomycetota bacterium]